MKLHVNTTLLREVAGDGYLTDFAGTDPFRGDDRRGLDYDDLQTLQGLFEQIASAASLFTVADRDDLRADVSVNTYFGNDGIADGLYAELNLTANYLDYRAFTTRTFLKNITVSDLNSTASEDATLVDQLAEFADLVRLDLNYQLSRDHAFWSAE